MTVINHNRPRGDCETCRALQVWRDKCREAERRLEIAEKAALACPKPLVWTSETPKVSGNYWCRYKDATRKDTWSRVYVDIVDTKYDCFIESERIQWAGPIPEPVEPKE